MSMYNLLESSDNVSKTSEILWQYCRNEPAINAAGDEITHFTANNTTTDSFKIKEQIRGETGANGTKMLKKWYH